jgi:hypothetical protein
MKNKLNKLFFIFMIISQTLPAISIDPTEIVSIKDQEEMIKKTKEESCPTKTIEYMANFLDSSIDDLILFLQKGEYNESLMKDLVNRDSTKSVGSLQKTKTAWKTVWGPFTPLDLQDENIAKTKKGNISRVLVAQENTNNSHRADGRATMPIRNICIALATILKRTLPEVQLQVSPENSDVSKENYRSGRILVVTSKDFDSDKQCQIDKLREFVNTYLNLYAEEESIEKTDLHTSTFSMDKDLKSATVG